MGDTRADLRNRGDTTAKLQQPYWTPVRLAGLKESILIFMAIEIKEATAEHLPKVDQLLPTALDSRSNTIVVAISEKQVLGAGLIETAPQSEQESCLRIEIAAPNSQMRQALVDHLSEVARTWDAESIELAPPGVIEGQQADFRKELGFEPKDESETWTLELPLKEGSLPEADSVDTADWSATIVSSKAQRAQVLALFHSSPLVASQTPAIAKLISNPETLGLSRVLIENDTDGSGTPRMTAALIVSHASSRGFPYFTTVHENSNALARLRFLAQDASASWEATSVKSMLLVRPVEHKPGPLITFAQENGATVTRRQARWVKNISS